MAIYCTHKELKRVFPQLDSFDGKKPIYGWEATTVSNKYVAHNTGLVTNLFVNGEELGAAQTGKANVDSAGDWAYVSDEDATYYFDSNNNPNDLLIEAGEDFTTVVTQYRTDASKYLDSMLDPNLPRESYKDKSGSYDYILVRTSALIAASFMIKSHEPNSELANVLMGEAMMHINNINDGKSALSFQTTRDSSRGVIRDVTYDTAGAIRPVDTRGEWTGSYDLVKVIITEAGPIGTAKYSVLTKSADKLKDRTVVDNKVIAGDYQPLAGGLEIRFAGDTDAIQNDEWEIEVFGRYEDTDASTARSTKMTRTKKHVRYY